MPSFSTPPGVSIDKQSSLRLVSTDLECHSNFHHEQDLESVLSEWTMDDSDDNDNNNDNHNDYCHRLPPAATTNNKTNKNNNKNNKKKFMIGKLRWRQTTSKSGPLPPSTSPLTSRYSGIRGPQTTPFRASDALTVTSHRTSASSSHVTTVSTATQKHSNQHSRRNRRTDCGMEASVATDACQSVTSGTPPMARIRATRQLPTMDTSHYNFVAAHSQSHASSEKELPKKQSLPECSIDLSSSTVREQEENGNDNCQAPVQLNSPPDSYNLSLENSIFDDLLSTATNHSKMIHPSEDSGSSHTDTATSNDSLDDTTDSTTSCTPNSFTTTKRIPGPIDIDTCRPSIECRNLQAMHKLGYAHLRRNQIHSAIHVFMEIVRGQRERHGKKSLEVAMAMHNLAVVCGKGQRYLEAVKLCDGAARIRVDKLGKDHLDVAVSLSQQGVTLMEMKEYPTALASFREALRIRRKALGSKHPLVVRLLNNIGCALFEMKELVESKQAFEEALDAQRDWMRQRKRGCIRSTTSAEDNAEETDAEKDLTVDPKEAHNMLLSIALTLCNLGSIHIRWGKHDKSLIYYEEALLIQESVLGEDHKVVLTTKESINFILQSEEGSHPETNFQNHVSLPPALKMTHHLASFLPTTYEETKRIYDKVHNEIAAVIVSVASSSPKSHSHLDDSMEDAACSSTLATKQNCFFKRKNNEDKAPYVSSSKEKQPGGHILQQIACVQPYMCVEDSR